MTETVGPQGAAAPAEDAYRGEVRPPAVLRIGVSGHRWNRLALADPEQLAAPIRAVLGDLHAALHEIAASATAAWLYRKDGARLQLMSALAEGADRLVVHQAVALRDHPAADAPPFAVDLVAALPFARGEYAKDFEGAAGRQTAAESVAEFNALLDLPMSVVELDGRPGQRDAAYVDAGRLIVRHSDVLLAVWDEADAEIKPGGTADVIDMALRYGMLVICVLAQPPYRVSLRDRPEQSPRGGTVAAVAYDRDAVARYLRRQLINEQSPSPPHTVAEEAEKRLTAYVEETVNRHGAKAPDYVANGPIEVASHPLLLHARVFGWLRNAFAGDRAIRKCLEHWRVPAAFHEPAARPPFPETMAAARPVLDRYFAAYLRADGLADHYAQRHRSVFVLIYLLGALALTAAAAALYFPQHRTVFGFLELALLGCIFASFLLDQASRYHERWIDYRVLAELIRSAMYLAPVGWTLPLTAVRERGNEISAERLNDPARQRSWVFIHFETLVRAAGVAPLAYTPALLESYRGFVAQNWLGGQIAYHLRNAARGHVFGRRLRKASLALFVATIVAVTLKLSGLHLAHTFAAGLLAIALPAFAGGFVAIRHHAEFDVVSQRSQTMQARLRRRLAALNRTAARTDAIGPELGRSARAMLSEVTDWSEIFELKESEPG